MARPRTLLIRLDELDHGAGRLDVVGKAPIEALRMLRIPHGNHGEARDLRMVLCPSQRLVQLFPVIDAGAKHNLRMDLHAGRTEALEHLLAAGGMGTDHLPAHVI